MQPDLIGPANPVVALCAHGIAVAAWRLLELARNARRTGYEAAIAARFVARYQAAAKETFHSHALAIRHAEAVADGRTIGFLASLYLNLGRSGPGTAGLR